MPTKLAARLLLPATPPDVKSRTKLGEGAVWDSERSRLLWIDIVKGKIFTYKPNGAHGESTFVDVRQAIGTVVPCTAQTVVAALCSGICEVSLKDGRIVKFYGNPEADLPENLWNDGKCDDHGRLWVGSKEIFCEKSTGALWSLEPGSGKWKKHIDGVGVSNGLVWAADGRTFYYIDTFTGRIDAFDYDGAKGTLSNRRPAVVVDTKADGHPDGCTIDSDGNIWVAMWGGGKVVRYDPLSGKALTRVPIPKASQVTSVAFGGEALDQLYVTTASCGIAQSELTTGGKEENAGALFVIDCSAAGVCGRRAPCFGTRNTSSAAGPSQGQRGAAAAAAAEAPKKRARR